MKDKIKKVLVFAGKLAISAALLWFVFSRIDLRTIAGLAIHSNFGWLAAALAFFILSKIVAAYRLNLFFTASGLRLSAAVNLRLYLLGMFYNLFLPGGVGGDAYKIILLNRKSKATLKNIFWATLVDRVSGLTALAVITIILSWWLPLPGMTDLFTAAAIPLVLGVSWIVIRKYFPMFRQIFISTNLQSAWVQVLQVCSALCILWALHHHEHTLLLLTVFLVSSVMAVIPITFGGAGAREFTFALTGSLLAFDTATRDAAIALGLLFYLITAVTSLAGIWYHFFPIAISETTDTGINKEN